VQERCGCGHSGNLVVRFDQKPLQLFVDSLISAVASFRVCHEILPDEKIDGECSILARLSQDG